MTKQDKGIVKASYPVLGMSCASCASSAESIVAQQNGVVTSSVNFATGQLTVSYQSEVTTIEALQQALQSAGFDLLLANDEAQQESQEAIQHAHYKQLKHKTTWAIILSLPVVVIGMFFMNMPYANDIMFAFTTPVVFWLGSSFYKGAYQQATHRKMNMDTLVALSTGIAYIYSVCNMLFANYWMQRGVHAHVYFEAAAVIIAFILLGKLLEEKAKGNTSTAIKKLMGLQPKTVTLVQNDGSEHIVPIADIQIGDQLMAKPGGQIAVDGVVIQGNSYIDESMLTGEPIPAFKATSDKVFAGTLNQKGSFIYEAKQIGKNTLLARIIKTVQDAQGSKAPVQKLVDKIAGIFVPIVMGIAVLTFVLWFVLGGEHAITHAIMASVTVLIIACPCALGLATPTAIMVGVGKGAELGILIKDAESLELAKNINAIILDKTGTITEGKPEVQQIYWLNNDNSTSDILCRIEQQSEHPLAQAVVKHLNSSTNSIISNFESITGKGASAQHNGITYYVGNAKLLHEHNIYIPNTLLEVAEQELKLSRTIIWFANNKEVLAVISIADRIKATSPKAISNLQNMGIELYMLTGDNEATAKAIAEQVGIKNYKAEVLPQDKADFVKSLQAQDKVVAMVGDGINDSTALATADVSIAMGKGSDIAIDVAKMTIISSDLEKIPQAIRLSRQTVATIKQNLFWAFVYNVIGIPIAAGILYPINGFFLNPMIAGAAMAMSSVSVVSNSLRLKWKK
jgi:Cu2+-exporting ATPase